MSLVVSDSLILNGCLCKLYGGAKATSGKYKFDYIRERHNCGGATTSCSEYFLLACSLEIICRICQPFSNVFSHNKPANGVLSKAFQPSEHRYFEGSTNLNFSFVKIKYEVVSTNKFVIKTYEVQLLSSCRIRPCLVSQVKKVLGTVAFRLYLVIIIQLWTKQAQKIHPVNYRQIVQLVIFIYISAPCACAVRFDVIENKKVLNFRCN